MVQPGGSQSELVLNSDRVPSPQRLRRTEQRRDAARHADGDTDDNAAGNQRSYSAGEVGADQHAHNNCNANEPSRASSRWQRHRACLAPSDVFETLGFCKIRTQKTRRDNSHPTPIWSKWSVREECQEALRKYPRATYSGQLVLPHTENREQRQGAGCSLRCPSLSCSGRTRPR